MPVGPEHHEPINRGAEIVWIVLAMAGGVARYLDAYLRTGVLPAIGLLLANAVVSGFSGYMVAQTVLKLSPDWALVAAGIGGYMGTQGLDWISRLLRQRIGGDLPDPGPPNPPDDAPKQ